MMQIIMQIMMQILVCVAALVVIATFAPALAYGMLGVAIILAFLVFGHIKDRAQQ
jgi:hypothetical protein